MATEMQDKIEEMIKQDIENRKGVRRISFYIDTDLLKSITELQLDYDISRSEIINLLIKLGLGKLKEIQSK